MNQPLPEGIIRTPEGIYVLRDDSHLSRWIEEHRRLDIAEPQIAHYAKYIPVGGTVIDAGACLGDHACTYAKLVGPSGSVWAFEPNPKSFAALKLNFSAWTNVKVYNVGLCDRNDYWTIHLSDNAGATYLMPDKAALAGDQVPMLKLDEMADLLRLDFIHLDCEGMERDALLGARALLAKFRPTIVLEINHGCLARYGLVETDVLATLSDLGYNWREIEPGHGPHLPQRDILALPQ